jgi:hypothetical protein
MKQIKMKLIFLACAAIVMAAACRKAKVYEVNIDQETKDYCLFDEGSYWIFQDSATMETDSISICEISYKEISEDFFDTYIVDDYQISYNCFMKDTIISFWGTLRNYPVGGELDKEDLSSLISNLYIPAHILPYPQLDFYYHSGKIGTTKNEIEYASFSSNYSTIQKTFNDVKIFLKHNYLYSNALFPYQIYWAKHVGPIRIEIMNEEQIIVYNLIRYNVKPYKK